MGFHRVPWDGVIYPPVKKHGYDKHTMYNRVWWIYLLRLVIVHRYVSLPDGKAKKMFSSKFLIGKQLDSPQG